MRIFFPNLINAIFREYSIISCQKKKPNEKILFFSWRNFILKMLNLVKFSWNPPSITIFSRKPSYMTFYMVVRYSIFGFFLGTKNVFRNFWRYKRWCFPIFLKISKIQPAYMTTSIYDVFRNFQIQTSIYDVIYAGCPLYSSNQLAISLRYNRKKS